MRERGAGMVRKSGESEESGTHGTGDELVRELALVTILVDVGVGVLRVCARGSAGMIEVRGRAHSRS